MPPLSREKIRELLEALNEELKSAGERGEVHLAGGAVMCLAFEARESTQDVDASFKPSAVVKEAALRVAERMGVPDGWLKDAVKGYLSDTGTYDPFLELSNLRIFCADARYMLAMKCLAMRMGEGYQDENDIRYLLTHLGIESYQSALDVIGAYYPVDKFPKTTLAALRELTADE